jgi:hypothetical protein
MTQYWIEQLQFSVEVFDEYGNLLEVLARLHDLDAARAAYGACRLKYPARSSTCLCQGGRILQRRTRHAGIARLTRITRVSLGA